MTSKRIKYFFVVIAALLATAIPSMAQLPDIEELQPVEELPEVISDSLLLAQSDSLAVADSLDLLSKSSIQAPAFTSAGDSIVEVFTGGKKLIYYYGGVTVEYENVTITSDYMEYDMDSGTVYARGTQDPNTKEWKGQPVMTQGGDEYNMEEVHYNFNTNKAYITNMVTNDSDGEIRGSQIQMNSDRSINMKDGQYTVCDLPEPHYYLKMTSAKVITEPSQKTVFGPAYLVVGGVPTPVILPYGFIPPKPARSTGMLTPSFGEEKTRGFYMRDAGMYFVIGQYFDLSITGDVYTMGSWALNVNSRYRVNYKFNGNISMNYSVDVVGEKDVDQVKSTNFGVKWSHSQDSKAHPGSTFSASVDFSSPSNNRYNARSINEAVQNQASSSISYGHNFDGKFNFSVNGRINQNSRDSSYVFTLPNISFSMSTKYPFKRKHRIGKERFYEKISIGYNGSVSNKVGFKLSDLKREEFNLVDTMQFGTKHNISIGLPPFTLFKYINFTPSVSYGMDWHFRQASYAFDPELGVPVKDEGRQFNTFGITQRYSGGISASTRLYGMFNFRRMGNLQAIRHVISPSVSMSFSPELGTAANGWRTLEYIDSNGQPQVLDYNIYAVKGDNNFPGKGKNASMSFSVSNNLEAKVRDAADSTGVGTKKVKLIDQLNFSSNYNFMTKKMGQISSTMTTTIFQKLTLNMNATFNPYAVNENGGDSDIFNFRQEGWLHPVRLTNANLSFSYNFSGEGTVKGDDGTEGKAVGKGSTLEYRQIFYHPVTGEYIPGGWLYYMNPNSPWNLNTSFSFGYRSSYVKENDVIVKKNNFTGTVSMSGSIQITPRMNMSATSGFDFIAMKLTPSSFNFSYDLHCFNIAVSWIPNGKWQSYSFRIAANASALADILRYKKSSSFWDN